MTNRRTDTMLGRMPLHTTMPGHARVHTVRLRHRRRLRVPKRAASPRIREIPGTRARFSGSSGPRRGRRSARRSRLSGSPPDFRSRRFPRSARRAVLPVCSALLLLLGGCNGASQTITLWSDRPEMAAVIELYNAEHPDATAVLRYTETPADDLLTRDRLPDLVFGDYIANKTIFPLLRPLDGTLERTRDTGSRFYAGLLSLGRYEESIRALPVSFDLPALMFKSTPENRALPEFAIEMSELREAGAAFNSTVDGEPRQIGFSPRWRNEFLYLAARLEGADFAEGEARRPTWDATSLGQSITLLREWTETANGGVAAEDAFEEQYLYDPPYQLLVKERIRFWYVQASDFFLYAEGKRSELGFRWVSGKDGIPVLENVRFMAMPRGAQNRRGSRRFLEWFFREETQRRIMNELSRQRVHSFGLLGGFSAMPRVNVEVFPAIHPSLLGRIPLASRLVFPNPLPKNWDAIKEDVVHPWLFRGVSGTQQDATLSEQVEAWLLQKGE